MINLNSKIKTLLICIAIPLIAGALSAFLTRESMAVFQQISKPALSPPAIVFPVVWTILYTLMGIASYLVFASANNTEYIDDAILFYAFQLSVNFFWSVFFFNYQWYLFSFGWLVLLWLLIIITILLFGQISKPAAFLMIPYLIWVTFAGYLNFSIYLLN